MNFDIEIPEYTKYLSQDKDGAWWCWEKKPKTISHFWDNDEPSLSSFLFEGIPPEDFTQELYKVIWE